MKVLVLRTILTVVILYMGVLSAYACPTGKSDDEAYDSQSVIAELQNKPVSYEEYCHLAYAYQISGNLELATSTYRSAADTAILSNDLSLQAKATRRLGVVELEMGQYTKAETSLQSAFDLAVEAKDLETQYRSMQSMGSSALRSRAQDRAVERFGEAIKIAQLYEAETPDADLASWYSRVYFNLASASLGLEELDNALDYLAKGLVYAREVNNPGVINTYLAFQAETEIKQENYDAAWRSVSEAIENLDGVRPGPGRLNILLTGATIAVEKRDATALGRILDQFQIELDAVDTVSPEYLASQSAYRLQLANLRGDREAAIAAVGDMSATYATAYSARRADEFAALEAKYELAKQETQIANLEIAKAEGLRRETRRQEIIYGLLGAFILTGLVIYLLWQRSRHAQRLRTVKATFDARVDERIKIARDVHDTVIQSFVANTLQTQRALDAISHSPQKASAILKRNLEQSDDAIRDARETIIANRLRVAPNLRAVVEELIERNAGIDSPEVSVDMQDCDDLKPEILNEMSRILNEAYLNAARHADAQSIVFEGRRVEAGYRLSVIDDGNGFDPALESGKRWGIVGMKERAEEIGAWLDISSKLGHGTRVVLLLSPR